MENKQIKHSFGGMSQDTSKSKFPQSFYFEGKNIRILATDSQSTGSITNEKGNELIITIPNISIDKSNVNLKKIIYGDKELFYKTTEIDDLITSGIQTIIGHSNSRKFLILFTTNNNGLDCIWSLQYDNYDLKLLYIRNMGFSENNPIQALNNFENKDIDKIYWINGLSQTRSFNIYHSLDNKDLEELINIPLSVLDMVPEYTSSQPIISNVISGGSHTAGMIQYAYNLYRLNSSQTKISPLSVLVPLDKNNIGGGSINEVVSSTPIININNIDPDFTNIRVYAIKYTSYNELPSVSLIDDSFIPSNRNIEIFDDGKVISTLSLEEFRFLGSDIIIPNNITSKDGRLFFANYNEVNFDVKLDTRAYSFKSDGTCKVYDNLYLDGSLPNGTVKNITNIFTDNSEYTDDSVNLDYSIYKYNYDGITIGGEGKYIKYNLTQTSLYNSDSKYFKDDEIYRLGVEFYNKYGQVSSPKWIADFKSRSGNLNNNYNTLKVTLKPEFYIWLNNSSNFQSEFDKPVGYRILTAERTINDRTIVANGLLSTMMVNDKSTRQDVDLAYIKEVVDKTPKLPNMLIRNANQNSVYGITQPLKRAQHLTEMCVARHTVNTEIQRAYYGDKDTSGRFYQYNTMMQMHSPEILFGESISLSDGLKLRVKGSLLNSYNSSWFKKYNTTDKTVLSEVKAYNGVAPFYATKIDVITGGAYETTDNGLISTPYDAAGDRVNHSMFYRVYGDVDTIDNYSINNQIVKFTIPFQITTGTEPDVDNPLIKYISSNRGVSITLNETNTLSKIDYIINPDSSSITTPYNIKICSDSSGENVLTSLDAVIGTQTITYSNNLDAGATIENSNYFLLIESINGFTINIDINAEINDSLNSLYLVKQSNGNSFIVDNNTPVTVSKFTQSPTNIKFDIYGTPELVERGQSFTTYNKDSKYRYSNSLQSFYSDGDSHFDKDGKYARKIVSMNSYGNKNLTFVLGDDNTSTRHFDRPLFETIFASSGLTGDNNGLIGEFVKSDVEIYLGNIYGGNSYEDKKRSNYIQIGNYKNINDFDNVISSPGDTFVSDFKFLRITNTSDNSSIEEGIYKLEEIVHFSTETTIDLKNRNDTSITDWDNKFQYLDEEYHKYNRVYSQTSNLIKSRDINYNVKKINNFDTNIISTKLKSSGELIDSWTNILQNEVITLDGKYGAINSLVNFNDKVFAIQDKAFSFISINPRVQVQGSDGISVELGSGGILQEYQYISTESGTLNKWSVVVSQNGIYYYDLINKSLMMFKSGLESISNTNGLHSYFINNTEFEDLKLDNPLIKKGISSGFDQINDEIFMTFHKGNKPFTISYNEKIGKFVSFYDYLPSIYISKGQYFITTSPTLKSLYHQYKGNYNNFYGQNYPSYVILNVNPAADLDTVFDNIMYKSEVYLNDIDQFDKTLTGVRLYSEYQDSGLIPLIVGRNSNLRRKFRDWNAILPRNQGSRERIRNPWVKLVLKFDNTSNYKLILHDVVISYSI